MTTRFQKFASIFCFIILIGQSAFAQLAPIKHIEGRWDITITKPGGKTSPSWLEVNHSGVKYLNGYFVGDGGSARPISRINFEGDKMSFSIPPQWDAAEKDLVVEGTLKDDKLSGTMNTPKGETLSWTAVRAPKLNSTREPAWGAPIKLFNGKNLDGWEATGATNQWIVENGILKSPKSGSNLRTTRTFNDFKLHVEFKYPEESNSGVYLRGRYEVQVTDSKGRDPLKDQLGAVYGFIAPLEMPAKSAGEWQSFDITLVGRVVTIALNGKTIIYKNEIPGITGGALDSNEGEPGPIFFQGDHGPIEYRNIVITPAK
ncbi:3-keto-disaccharide hydrolase [Emticicia fontis]